MTNLRSLDLNLLTVFEAVYEGGSITRAAERLALSQSATSHAVTRLRETCADDLFVRVAQGIAPTPVAQRIYPEIKRALDGLRRAVAEARGFDPATSTRHFHIAIPHPMGPVWAMALRRRLAIEAPQVVLEFDTRTIPNAHFEQLRDGGFDLAVDWVPADGDRFVNRKLFEDPLDCLARRDHPRAQPRMTAEALRAEEFVRVHPRPGPVSDALAEARARAERAGLQWVLHVSEYLEVPYLVMTTDLMGFVPASVIHAVRDAGVLQIVELPTPVPPIPMFLVWHETRRADEGHRWLRDLVAEAVIANTGA